MLTVWTEPSGYSFGTLQEQVALVLPLPVADDAGVNYKVISGKLPSGLFLSGNEIIGSPYIVSNVSTYTFCIRASKNNNISDRTFNITVNGYNPPIFVTPPGDLAIGVNQQLYTTDQTYVAYQLEVTDLNAAVGKQLTFYIASGDGDLPSGLSMSSSGLISGYILPAPKITVNDGSGNYDESTFDAGAFDFGLRSTNGFDTYHYDDVIFDYSVPSIVSQTLSINYQFKVTVTDGLNYTQRIFKIFVTGTDEFRADSTTPDGLAGGFTADSTYVRRPVWLTGGNLGIFRSNNYLTVPVALYDNTNVTFRLETTNTEVYAVGYQISYTDNVSGSLYVTIENASQVPVVGQYFTLEYYIDNASSTVYEIKSVETLSSTRYRLTLTTPLTTTIPNNTPFYIGSLSILPPGVSFDEQTGDVYGMMPYQPAITKEYKFTITASRPGDNFSELVSTSKTFNIIILGSIDSVITWNSSSNLGSIPADYICNLSISASTNISGAVVTYELVGGSLPPGLSLSGDGEIVGIVNQYVNYNNNDAPGLITFDLNSNKTTFDGTGTTFDRTYTFTVKAGDQYGYSAITKDFTISLTTPNSLIYNNITARPFLKPSQRSLWNSFINNNSIFTPSSIYRPNDPNFGIQPDLNMLVYAGIQNVYASAIISAMSLNNKLKRFQFGSLEKAIAIDPVSRNTVYEVVYIQMIDPLEIDGKHLPLSIISNSPASESITTDNSMNFWSVDYSTIRIDAPSNSRPDYMVTADSTGYQAGNAKTNKYFPNSITNWQTRLASSGATERNYLPLWMRSIQSGQKSELGYVLAVPLCFCMPGAADTILTNIKFNGFNFKDIDYSVDRYTLSSAAGYASDKYLIFKNNRITV